MADALPPDTQVQLESLRAFSKDLELSVRTQAKGYGTKPVELPELRRWLDAALASNTDAPMRPQEAYGQAAFVMGSSRQKVLTGLLERVKARVTALEGGTAQAKESTREWLMVQLGELATGEARVPEMKGGGSHPASLEEVKMWLAESAQPTKKMKD